MKRILFISHEASRTGAPIMLLSFMRWLGRETGWPLSTVLAYGGELEREFATLGPVIDWRSSPWHAARPLARAAGKFRLQAATDAAGARWLAKAIGDEPTLIYANSLASAPLLRALQFLKAPTIVHVHELETVIRLIGGNASHDPLLHRASRVIACADAVRSNLIERHGVAESKIDVVHEFIDVARASALPPKAELAARLRSTLGLAGDTRIIGASGALGWRKGSDLFLQVARRVMRDRGDRIAFVWLGATIPSAAAIEFEHDVRDMGLSRNVHCIASQPNPLEWCKAFDVFLLPSREDPFPLVCLEAAACSVPIICFDGAGGIPEFVQDDAGIRVPYLDVDAMARETAALLDDATRGEELAETARARVAAHHDIPVAAPRLYASIRSTIA